MLRRLIGAVVAAIAATLALAGPAFARSADITSAEVALRLAPDGALLVTERLTFEYDGHFEGSYRDINLNFGERITDVQVSQDGQQFEPGGNTGLGSFDRPGVFGTVDLGDRYRIVWHYRATDETRTTTLSYRVEDAVIAYEDILDVTWAVWGAQWEFDLDRLSAGFTNPALDTDDPLYRVWGHIVEDEGEFARVEGETSRERGEATLEATDVPSGTAVEFRVTMPRDPGKRYPAARPGEGEGLPRVLAFEAGLDAEYNSTWNRFKRFVGDHALLLSLLIAALAWLVVALLMWLARERETGVPEYLPEPPDEATPALAYALAHEGRDSTDTVLATLLDLVDRGYYDTGEATTEKEKLDLAIQQRPNRPDEELTPYEQDVLAFFDQLLDGERVAMSEMKEKIPKHSELWRGRWERMTEKLDEVEEGQLSWDRNLNGARWLTVLGAAIAFAAVILIAISERGDWFFAAVVAFVTTVGLMALSATRFKRVSADARRAHRALARVRALDRGLPAPLRRPAGDARAVEADPRLRGRVRDRRADDRVGADPGPCGHRRIGRRPLELLRLRRRLQQLELQRLQLQLRLLEPGRAAELVERWRGRVLGRRGRVLGRRRRRLVVAGRRSPSACA